MEVISATTTVSADKKPGKKHHHRSRRAPPADAMRVLPITAASPVTLLSPILMPYVRSPVCYVTSDSPHPPTPQVHGDAANVRYLPALTCTTYVPSLVAPRRRKPHHPAVYGSPCRHNYVPAVAFGGYVVAPLTPAAPLTQAPKSTLNPLSTPYTPRSAAAKSSSSSLDGGAASSCTESTRSGCSTPDSWRHDGAAVAEEESPSSPAVVAVSPVEPSCRDDDDDDDDDENAASDVDSGVEGDGDDWLCFGRFDGVKSSDDEKNADGGGDDVAAEFPDLTNFAAVRARLAPSQARLIDFVCDGLAAHEWRAVARELGVSDVVIQSVEYGGFEPCAGFRDQMRRVFAYWARGGDVTAETRAHVERALREIGRHDLIRMLEERDFFVGGGDAETA